MYCVCFGHLARPWLGPLSQERAVRALVHIYVALSWGTMWGNHFVMWWLMGGRDYTLRVDERTMWDVSGRDEWERYWFWNGRFNDAAFHLHIVRFYDVFPLYFNAILVGIIAITVGPPPVCQFQYKSIQARQGACIDGFNSLVVRWKIYIKTCFILIENHGSTWTERELDTWEQF